MKVETCIQRYGRQSVDMVFDQIKHEPFSLGENTTGFKADFDFIFRIDQYEKYLERYKLRIRGASARKNDNLVQEDSVQASSESPYRAEDSLEAITERRKAFLVGWVEAEANNSTARGRELLQASYESGELQRLGIQWHP